MTEEAMRKAFEAWALANGFGNADIRSKSGSYIWSGVQGLWDAWQAATRAAAPAWLPIESAPEGVMFVVGWLDSEDTEHPERHDFDWLEDGSWLQHSNNVEYAEMVAPPGSRVPKDRAPYTHCMPVPPLPAAPEAKP